LAAEGADRSALPVPQALAWVSVALAAAIATYYLIENPIRHLAVVLRHRWASIGLGGGLIALTLILLTFQLQGHAGSDVTKSAPVGVRGTGSVLTVEQLVASSMSVRKAPSNLTPAIFGGPPAESGCWPTEGQTDVPSCVFGDPLGSHTMVFYGDSHAAMWFQPLDDIARKAHWKMAFLSHGSCPPEMVPILSPPGVGAPGSEYQACNQWHTFAIHRINALKPDLVLVTQAFVAGPHFVITSAKRWKAGFESVFRALAPSHARIEVLGNIPLLNESGPDCLARHPDDIQVCSRGMPDSVERYRSAEQAVAAAHGARYVDLLPLFCQDARCPVVIGRFAVYLDREHVAAPYADYLEGVLDQLLGLPIGRVTPQDQSQSTSQ
jgi:hypothetical protein